MNLRRRIDTLLAEHKIQIPEPWAGMYQQMHDEYLYIAARNKAAEWKDREWLILEDETSLRQAARGYGVDLPTTDEFTEACLELLIDLNQDQ